METSTQNTNAPKYNPQDYVQLADKIYLDYIKNAKYRDIINSMTNLGDYSLRNQMLILHQFPNATKVNSMNGWNFNKRSVQKGSTSIKILAPVFDSVVKTENGQVVEKKSDYISGYKINFVFDISQTEPRNSEKANESANFEIKSLEPYYDAISKALKDTLKSYEIVTGDIESDGVLDTRQRTITLKQGLTKEQTLRTLIDQVSAALILGRNRDNFQGLRSEVLPNATAIEISAVSAIVCKRLGLKNNNIQEPDFSKMEEAQIDKFANNLGVIRSVSQRMILAADNAIEEELILEQLADEAALEQQLAQENKKQTKKTVKANVKAEMEME